MDNRFRVEGIYDKRTIQRLKDLKLIDLSFDFRPRSFNFLQKHLLEELLKETSQDDSVFLHFENEADFVIQSILDSASIQCKKENIYLDFSCDQGGEFYDTFDYGYIWQFNEKSEHLDSIVNSKNIKGISLNFSDLLNAKHKGTLHALSNTIHTIFFDLLTNKNGLLILNMDWDSNLFSSIVQYFDFDIVSLAINNKVEICYRNVDLSKVQNHVNYLRELSL